MLIRNASVLKNIFKCKKYVADYLSKEKQIPFVGFDEDFCCFTDNEMLKEVLEKSPFHIKVVLFLERKMRKGG